jgi:hypothetical protein
MRILRYAFGIACVILSDAADVDCNAMRTKELRAFLSERGLRCEGCAEKSDFVAMCEEHKDTPVQIKDSPQEDPPKGSDQSIEELLASMKGMPGMENIKMFTPDDLNNMNTEEVRSTIQAALKPSPLH